MFCSFTVGPKSTDNPAALPPKPKPKPSSDWAQVIRSTTSEWARSRPRVSAQRNIGGTPKKKWTAGEDALLLAAIRELGALNWSQVSVRVPGRSGKQCRERWLDKLSPDVARDDWSPDEDAALIRRQAELGNAWSKIRDALPRRSVGAIKNRWNWLSRRDVPNHAEEFQAIAESQRPAARGPDAPPAAQERDIWGDLDPEAWNDPEIAPFGISLPLFRF
jgi:hypothetical protein